MTDLTSADLPFLAQMLSAEDNTITRMVECGIAGPEAYDTLAAMILAKSSRDEATLMSLGTGHPDPDVRRAVLRNEAVFPALVSALTRDPTWLVSEIAADHDLLPAADMDRIVAERAPFGAVMGLAMNPSCPPRLLVVLADDNRDLVRARVAWNPATPLDVAERLARDPESATRSGAAHSSRLPHLLPDLAADPDEFVRWHLAGNPAITAEAAGILAGRSGESLFVLKALAQNPGCPAPVLDRLARMRVTQGWQLRRAVCANPFAGEATLLRLAHGDRAGHIRDAAALALASRLRQAS